MHQAGLALLLGALLTAQPEDPDGQQAAALQRVMQRAVADVEPAIACVLVSRSDAYERMGLVTGKPQPGRLGDFDPDAVDALPGVSRAQAPALRKKLDLADPGHVPQSFGSGVVLDPKGLVLTSYHVVQDATKVFVRLPGGAGSYADVHAADPRSDLAVLRLLSAKLPPLKVAKLGDAGRLKRGQFLLSVANPFAAGFRDGQPSASWGVLSGTRRRTVGQPREEESARPLHHYGILLQTDARLHLGCSGGAVVDLRGEVVGISTALAAIHGGETPGGFAVPVDAGIRRVIETLLRGEEVEYGFLGVSVEERPGDSQAGVMLAHVTPGSPARLEAGLAVRDVLQSINGIPLRQTDDLFFALGTQPAGGKVKLQVRRAGSKDVSEVEVTLAKLHAPGKKIASSLGKRPFYRGLRVDYTSLVAQIPPRQASIAAGVLVTDVQPDSAADKAFLKTGEIITHVAGSRVATPAAFYDAVARLPGAVELTLHSFSNDPPSRVTLRP